jgi:hypothetical protein
MVNAEIIESWNWQEGRSHLESQITEGGIFNGKYLYMKRKLRDAEICTR